MNDIRVALENALAKAKASNPEAKASNPATNPELKQTLAEWDTSEKLTTMNTTTAPKKNFFQVRNNVSRATFEYIKQNPGSTRKEIIAALEHKDYNPASVSSLVAQLINNKYIHATNGLHYADSQEYRPVKSRKALVAKGLVKQSTRASGIAALPAKTKPVAPAPVPAPVQEVVQQEAPRAKRVTILTPRKDPQELVNNMTVYQAKELYEHLKQLFGG